MAKQKRAARPKASLPKGFRDVDASEIRRMDAMLAEIRGVFETYGFEPLDTPAFEFTEALGKFLPDQDRPNAGVFSLQDDDERWLSLRYDLTAPLARHVAENFQTIPKPFRRYAFGPVWRNEKPGPGRFRQFMQFDADTVGTESVAADAEICMLAADTLERLGIARGNYVLKVNNRKVLDGIMQAIGIDLAAADDAARRLTILRAMDKLDRLGIDGVRALLGGGRMDDSGDFTKGAELTDNQIALITGFLEAGQDDAALSRLADLVGDIPLGREGVAELATIRDLVVAGGYDADRITIDPSVVRGLEYYTGPVFEAELTFESRNEDGDVARFGSVGGGGRYDDLVARFTGQRVPATGISIGVSRLAAALAALDAGNTAAVPGPVVVLVMDRDELPRYQRMAAELRNAGVRAEMYVGTAGMKAQMKYADRRNAPCVVIQGGSERDVGEVQIKDLIEGTRLSSEIKDAAEWKEARPAQFSVAEADLVSAVQNVLARHGLA
ncbi:MAG: histidine--tRNA ligase [Pseudomonadota bacterium]